MNRKKKIMMITALCACCLLVVTAVVFFLGEGSYRSVQLQGYTISIPEAWTTVEDGDSLILQSDEGEVGRFSLLYTACEIGSVPVVLGYAPEEPQVSESDGYATKVYEIAFRQGEDEYVQYIFDALPDAPPYHAVLTLKNVSKKTSKAMLLGFKLPRLGGKIPTKPMELPTEEFLEGAVYTVQRDTSVYAYHLSRLDRLIQAGVDQPADDASVLHILSYKAEGEERSIKTWYYVSVGAGEKWLYSYEAAGDGTYYFRNGPKLIKQITREVSAEENYTRYFADGELILDAPYNPYAENAEALLAYKDTVIGDNSDLTNLVQQSMPAGVAFEGLSLEMAQEPYGLTIRYSLQNTENYIQENELKENAFYQNALVIFSLIENVDWIQMEIRSGETVFSKRYERKKAEEQFDNQDLRDFTSDAKAFETFTENVPKITPPSENDSGIGIDGTRVVYTTTVVVPSDMRMPHPRTGVIVAVKDYAERFGVTEYLDKPITVTLYEKTDAGAITMWATGSYAGAELASYPITSRAEFDRLLGLVQ